MIASIAIASALPTDPAGALMRTIGKIEHLAREAAVNEPFKFTSVLSDGDFIYAVRHSTDDAPPTLFHRQRDDHFMVVSEPFDEDENCDAWREVPAGQMLVIEKRGRLDMVPFVPGI
jgi:glutamine amidotransferase